jgi:hypothetical protein
MRRPQVGDTLAFSITTAVNHQPVCRASVLTTASRFACLSSVAWKRCRSCPCLSSEKRSRVRSWARASGS